MAYNVDNMAEWLRLGIEPGTHTYTHTHIHTHTHMHIHMHIWDF